MRRAPSPPPRTTPSLQISAADTLVDAPPIVSVRELGGGRQVWATASFEDDLGQRWVGKISATADAGGEAVLIDPVGDALGGTRLLWSMTLEPQGSGRPLPFPMETTVSVRPIVVQLEVRDAEGQALARGAFRRHFLGSGVTTEEIRRDGLVGTLFHPTRSRGSRPVLVVGGSNGWLGWSRQVAALLASHGATALALAYFDWQGREGLPRALAEIPLETFERAIQLLRALSGVDSGLLTVVGISRGAELSLLLGARLSEVKAVVAVSPSSVLLEASTPDPSVRKSSWTHRGEPLPFLSLGLDAEFYRSFDKTRIGPFFTRALGNRTAAEAARIPVEQIGGPVLLVAGTHDSLGPTVEMARSVAAALPGSHRRQLLVLEGAGHAIWIPFLPAEILDGSPEANAAGDIRFWLALSEFLALE